MSRTFSPIKQTASHRASQDASLPLDHAFTDVFQMSLPATSFFPLKASAPHPCPRPLSTSSPSVTATSNVQSSSSNKRSVFGGVPLPSTAPAPTSPAEARCTAFDLKKAEKKCTSPQSRSRGALIYTFTRQKCVEGVGGGSDASTHAECTEYASRVSGSELSSLPVHARLRTTTPPPRHVSPYFDLSPSLASDLGAPLPTVSSIPSAPVREGTMCTLIEKVEIERSLCDEYDVQDVEVEEK